jgi:hypothetical protein
MQSEQGGPFAVELATAVLLSVATLAASWAAYQATRWSGEQAAKYSLANARRVEATRAAEGANTQELADVVAFTSWLSAFGAGNARLEAFYRERLRPEFRPAFERWLESRPLVDPRAPPTPFALPEYRLALAERADGLQREGERLFREGQAANAHADNYVLGSVVLSGVLFFAGISQQLRRLAMRVLLLALATLLCLAGLVALLRLPVM